MNNINSALFQIDKFDTNFFDDEVHDSTWTLMTKPINENGVLYCVIDEMSIVDFLLLSDEIDKFIDHEH